MIESYYFVVPSALNLLSIYYCRKLWKEKKRAGAICLLLFTLVCMAYPVLYRVHF